jgi:calcium-dependent protein kinase
MQNASQDDVSQALSSMSAENRSKIQEAMMVCSAPEAKPVLERKTTGEILTEINQQDFLQEAWKANQAFFSGAQRCDPPGGSGNPDEMWLPGQAQKDFLEAFDMGKAVEFAIGGQGEVFKVTKKSTEEQHEVAKYNKKKSTKGAGRIKRSVEIREKVSHPNVAKLLETFEDKENIHVVFEGTFEKDLMDRLIDNGGPFKDSQARIVMTQVFRALEHLHRHHVFSGKCIPENFRFTTPDPVEDPKNMLKLFDLFEARYCGPGKVLTDKRGSPNYVAAEVIDAGRYNELADMWSAGVIMFMCVTGFPPLWGPGDPQILQCVKVKDLKQIWEDPDVSKVSSEAQDLLKKLITRSVPERSTAEKALQHPWLNVPP